MYNAVLFSLLKLPVYYLNGLRVSWVMSENCQYTAYLTYIIKQMAIKIIIFIISDVLF
jgi:hypothetical protein